MPRLWLFNPENDIALASGSANFTPPPAAIEMRRAGQLLPLFLCGADDRVVCEGINNHWFEDFRERFGIEADVWNHSCAGFTPRPWGWSMAARRTFEHIGFSRDALPSDAQLKDWRELSHRRTAALLHDYISRHTGLRLWPKAIETADTAVLSDIVGEYGRAVVKQPWSSSGRGVKFFDSERNSMAQLLEQAAGTIRRQGSVMVERMMTGHSDFALLYECKDGAARYVGPSVFNADSSGNYTGNLVERAERLRIRLEKLTGRETLENLVDALRSAISSIIAPRYEGPVGIDLCYGDGLIHICEANLRYTMGFVALGIANHLREDEDTKLLAVGTEIPAGAIPLTPPGTSMRFFIKGCGLHH